MRLMGDSSAITRPGQFVNIALDSFYLRRPISVCDWDEDGFTILYKILGHGTAAMKALEPGTSLDILTGLGERLFHGTKRREAFADRRRRRNTAFVWSGQTFACGGGKRPLPF